MAQMATMDRANSVSRKHVPPPLVLHPAGGANSKELTVPSPLNSSNSLNGQDTGNSGSSSTSLPYLKGESPDESGGVRYEDDLERDDVSGEPKLRISSESEKRAGGVYDDLDLDLGEVSSCDSI